MVGRQTADNRFGFSSYVVGPTLGDGCNYTVIQTAIDDAFADGGGQVLIRPGSYIESLTLRNGVDLYGAEVDGRLPTFLSPVNITGNHTFTAAGGLAICFINCISLDCVIGDLFTMTATGGATMIMAAKFSSLGASTDPASRCVVLNPDGGSVTQFSTDNSNLNSSSHTFEMIGAGSGAAILVLGSFSSNAGDAFRLTSGSGSLSTDSLVMSAGGSIFNGVAPAGSASIIRSSISSINEAFLFPAAAGGATVRHSSVSSGAVSGFWADGTGGTVQFGDVLLTGSAKDIGPLVGKAKDNWQPYAETAAAAFASNRGTSSYDSTQFTVTDGWVQLVSPATPFTWVDQTLSVIVNSNQGNFTLALITLTLPPAPAQGDVCKFKQISNDNINVTANVGQIIQLGTAGGTNAATTSTGDALELTYYAAGAIWMANAVIGNWVLS